MKKIMIMALMMLPIVGISQSLTVKAKKVKISFLAAMQKTEGTIGGLEATINFNPDDLAASTISGSVDVSTLSTENEKRDDHLKSKDFFEMETYPKMTFSSKSIKAEGDTYVMTGIMKIKGDEHEEKITFSYKDKMFVGECTIFLENYNVGKFSKNKGEKGSVKISFAIPVE
ncbi:MAG: YceI family protein [Crocinitomicaceae bacterium]